MKRNVSQAQTISARGHGQLGMRWVGIDLHCFETYRGTYIEVTGYSCACRAKCIGKCILKLANQNLWYEQCEQLDSRGGGALSQGAGHDGSFYRYAV